MRVLKFALLAAAIAAGGVGTSCSSEERSPRTGVPWKDLTHEERLAYMKSTVMPKMKSEFAAFDAKDFGDMNCATCHGDGAKDKSFKMPNPKLPKLPTTEEGFKKLSEEHPDAVKFMRTKVVPDMAALLGVSPYDPKTHQGFGCFQCHPKKE